VSSSIGAWVRPNRWWNSFYLRFASGCGRKYPLISRIRGGCRISAFEHHHEVICESLDDASENRHRRGRPLRWKQVRCSGTFLLWAIILPCIGSHLCLKP
jgi:hypothetical protein